jgi:F-type H+-transporting ATPase subunit b
VALATVSAVPAQAQTSLLTPNGGLMVWTLIVFGILFFVLRRFAWPVLLESVEAREKSLRDAIAAAELSRAESERLLAEHKAQLDAARADAQKIIADGRAVAEKMRVDHLAETKKQQDEMLARVKRDIETEKTNAVADLRREAIDLAISGASKVIGKNLDDATNRKLVGDFLSTVGKS